MGKLEIDTKMMHDELVSLREFFKRHPRMDDLKYSYDYLEELSTQYKILTGEKFDYSKIFSKQKETEEMIRKYYWKTISGTVDFMMDNIDIINLALKKYNKNVRGFLDVPVNFGQRNYSYKDFKDMILDYFDSFGEKERKVASRLFDEKRIELGLPKDGKTAGRNTSNIISDVGYIFMMFNELNSYTASSLVHEIGHEIQHEMIEVPRMLKRSNGKMLYIEVISSFFEMGFLNLLIDKRIDDFNSRAIIRCFEDDVKFNGYTIEKIVDTLDNDENVQIIGGMDITCLDGKTVSFWNSMIYGFGRYMGLFLNSIIDGDYKGFMKDFYSMLSLSDKLSIEESLDVMGIKPSEFIECDKIYMNARKNDMELRRKLNM